MRRALCSMLVIMSAVGCATTGTRSSESLSTLPVRVYAIDRGQIWDAMVKVAMSIPAWDIIAADPHSGALLVEQRFRDVSFGGSASRIAITLTPVDEGHTKVEAHVIEAGTPMGQREHNMWRFFGDLDQILGVQ